MDRLLIKNGTVYDGENEDPMITDLLVEGTKILDIGKFPSARVENVIDATGFIVCPGFIDMHSHNDLVPFQNMFDKVKVSQGVTTELVGQCGLGAAPVNKNYLELWKDYTSAVLGIWPEENKWLSFQQYLQAIDGVKKANNIACLVSHGAIRCTVKGFSNSRTTQHEIRDMENIIDKCMQFGAHGLSTGLVYMPCVHADAKELVDLCRIVAQNGGIFVPHIRTYGFDILRAIDEIIEIALQGNVRLHFPHLRSFGIPGRGRTASEIIMHTDKYINEGVNLTFDQQPYTAGSTLLSQLLPPWVLEGKKDLIIERLNDYNYVSSIKKALRCRDYHLKEDLANWENYSRYLKWKDITITYVKTSENKWCEGLSIEEIAHFKKTEPIDVVIDLIIAEKMSVGIVMKNLYRERDIIQLSKNDKYMFGSDGIPVGKPHPRLFGTFPRVIGRYVRDLKVLNLAEAIRKLTSFPAGVLGIRDRGILEVGKFADIVVFDFNKIRDYEDYVNPKKSPVGIEWVIVNGKITVKKGNYTGISAGKLIKK